MVEKKYLAPNGITAANLLLGYLSITASIKSNYTYVYLVYIFSYGV